MNPTLAAALTAPRVLVFCGSGLSAESGVPTYRGRGSTYDGDAVPSREDDLGRLRTFRTASPNRAHEKLASLPWENPGTEYRFVTTNVDGMLTRAGCLGVVELHGSFERWRCSRCFRPTAVAAACCRRCGSSARPDVVRFGESLFPPDVVAAKLAAASCNAVVAVGTSGVVWPANEILASAAREPGVLSVEINPEETELSCLFGERIRLGAVEAFS